MIDYASSAMVSQRCVEGQEVGLKAELMYVVNHVCWTIVVIMMGAQVPGNCQYNVAFWGMTMQTELKGFSRHVVTVI